MGLLWGNLIPWDGPWDMGGGDAGGLWLLRSDNRSLKCALRLSAAIRLSSSMLRLVAGIALEAMESGGE